MTMNVVQEVVENMIKKLEKKFPLPTCIEDLISSFAFGEMVTLNSLLEMMGKADISETAKGKFMDFVRPAFQKATLWGEPTNKLPLTIWGQGISPSSPFQSIYIFLKHIEEV